MLAFAIIGGLIWVGLVTWAVFDAFEKTEMGCLWLFLLAVASPITLPLYAILKVASDKANKRAYEYATPAQEEYSRFDNEFEKLKFLREAERPGGTMYDPGPPADPVAPYGFFSDEKADALIAGGQTAEAWKYLIDMFSVAFESGDKQAAQTYSFYIHRLPEGKDNLAAWLNSHSGETGHPVKEIKRNVPF